MLEHFKIFYNFNCVYILYVVHKLDNKVFYYLFVRPQRSLYAIYFNLAAPLTVSRTHTHTFSHTISVATRSLMLTVSWLRSYLTGLDFVVWIHNIHLTLFEVFSSVLQGCFLASLLWNVFINDFCKSIEHPVYFLFADDVEICRTVSSATGCTVLQCEIDSIS